ncbi:MAG: hypothetical protein PVJ64_16640 [Gemmatimonadales bacterium]|jgi:hypothetical protein
MTNPASRTLNYGVGATFGAVMVFCVALLFGQPEESTNGPNPDLERGTTEQIRMILIGSSACGAQRNEDLREAIEAAKRDLAERFTGEGKQFASTGVALDWRIEDGLEFLGAFGEFDEVIVGGNWLNAGAVRYIWRDFPGASTVPQVVVLKRSVTVSSSTISVGEEELLARLAGTEQVMKWVDLGAPIAHQ